MQIFHFYTNCITEDFATLSAMNKSAVCPVFSAAVRRNVHLSISLGNQCLLISACSHKKKYSLSFLTCFRIYYKGTLVISCCRRNFFILCYTCIFVFSDQLTICVAIVLKLLNKKKVFSYREDMASDLQSLDVYLLSFLLELREVSHKIISYTN